MEDPTELVESLLENATEYGKTSLELAKLKAIDKTSDIASSILSHAVVLVFIASFLLFLSLGFAFWIGKILGEIYFGFFVVAAFYGLSCLIYYLLMHRWLKSTFRNSFIKLVLK